MSDVWSDVTFYLLCPNGEDLLQSLCNEIKLLAVKHHSFRITSIVMTRSLECLWKDWWTELRWHHHVRVYLFDATVLGNLHVLQIWKWSTDRVSIKEINTIFYYFIFPTTVMSSQTISNLYMGSSRKYQLSWW